MNLLLAVLSVLFFQLVYFDAYRGGGIVGLYMVESPLLGLVLGVFLAMMSGPCFGKQTPFKRRLSLLGAMALFAIWFLVVGFSRTPGVTVFTGIPFLSTLLPLLIRRLREDPEREAADRKAKVQAENARFEEIRSALSRKPPSLP